MRTLSYDVAIIGAGAAGMSCAKTTCGAGLSAAVFDREEHPGGILLQCIHNGFGLHHFKEELTGPEYAERVVGEAAAAGAELHMGTTVSDVMSNPDGTRTLVVCSKASGVARVTARAVVLAMGCRERNRGNLGIPGSRPSGVFTAGLAQRFINMDGFLPGREAVVIGSGDIGLIMARRLTWMGVRVNCVVEILPYSSGLTRNIAQCLDDFDIPLHLSHAVSRIRGRDRVEAVEITPLVDGVKDFDKTFTVSCDTILLSVGLVPENELSKKAGVGINHGTGGPYVDSNMMTSLRGVFACGNVLHVHDLVDFVSEESEACGRSVVEYLRGTLSEAAQGAAIPGPNIKYVTPDKYRPGADNHFYMRSMVVRDKAELSVRRKDDVVFRKKLLYVKPAEMLSVVVPGGALGAESSDDLVFSLE